MVTKERPRFSFGEVVYQGHRVNLTYTEFRILIHLTDVTPEPLTTVQLNQEIYGRPADRDTRNIKVHVANLRQKLAAAHVPITIESKNRFGYRALLN